ncbi:zinc-ribbon domain-containing protein [Methanobrevibacter sp.]|uniref:zinc-ribbon domain-containing protein n=1 Tax=Methanobrevibacter sp. TaxID=66852 RepID=UPI0025D88F5C|nr:zinc-ribbon domain-containing protein [Methanobrevibacter sp.]
MVICPDCGKEVKDAKFCSNCGSRLPEVADAVSEEKIDDAIGKEVVEDVPVEEVEAIEEEAVEEVPVEEVLEGPAEEVEAIEEESVDDVVEEKEEIIEEPIEEKEEAVDVNVVKKSKFCPNCGNEVTPETVFCSKCGFRLIGEEKPQTKFCQNCGKKIDINAEICPHCGVRVANRPASEEKNVLLSPILSFLFPGLGHLYLGLSKKGISFILAYIVSAILIFLFIGIVLMIAVWLGALIDSIKSTEAINRGEYVEDKLF